MVEYRTSAHAVFDIKYHFVWITKYRYKILRGLAERARDLLRQICQARDAVIVRGAVSPDHIHMLASLSGGYCASEAGAVPEGSFVAKAAGRISGTAKAVLEAAPVGARLLLRERGAVDEETIKMDRSNHDRSEPEPRGELRLDG